MVALALVLNAGLGMQDPEPIQDNSFLIEEAYNQERGVVQHISTFSRSGDGEWALSFTQEWPLVTQRHQLSYSIPLLRLDAPGGSRTGFGDIALNYRYQLIGLHGGSLAMSPRASVLLPTGNEATGQGAGSVSFQASWPVSISLGQQWATHLNAGMTVAPSARNGSGASATTTAVNAGGSVIWLPLFWMNFMVEAVWASSESVTGPGATERQDAAFLNPGIRWAINLPGDLQIVPGVAWTIGIGPSRGDRSIFIYFSIEHPFKHVSG